MKTKSSDEYVMVFPANILETLGYFQGLHLDPSKYIGNIESQATFRLRSKVENDFLFKQLIPYVIVTHNGSVLSYRRGARSSESRLKGNRSIGIGGHISASDPNLFSSSYEQGMYRELNEELRIDSTYNIKLVAMLNDDSNEVGRVHFGLIHLLILSEAKVTNNEQAISDLKFLSYEKLSSSIDEYENWSQICIRQLLSLLNA